MSNQSIDDHALVAAAQADPHRFRTLYERYASSMYRYVFSYVQDHPTAEDLTAQVFLQALENLPSYRLTGPFAAWLFTIARNTINSHFRKPYPTLTIDEVLDALPADTDPVGDIEHKEQITHLVSLLELLEEDKQELLRLRYASGLTYREIGKVIGKREGAVKMAIHRILDDLLGNMGGME